VTNSDPSQSPSAPGMYSSRTEETRTSGQYKADLAADAAPEPLRPGDDLRQRQEQLLDEAIEETFPASDPISPKRITK
jgi:hypothetical protein